MHNTYGLGLLLLLLQGLQAVSANQPSQGEKLEKLVPHAAGVAQVEVVEIKEVDMRPGDGPLYLEVRFRILQSSGVTTETIAITMAHGGHFPPNTPPFKPYGPIKFDTFKKGGRYWVAFCSQYDGVRCPQGIVQSWPDGHCPKLIEDAIQSDHYAHRPQYHPKSGFTHSYRTNKDKKSWQVQLEREGKRIWEAVLPGEKFKGDRLEGKWRLIHRDHWPSGLQYADKNGSGWYLFAESSCFLESGNAFGLPAKAYRMTCALDADTGKISATWVTIMGLGPTSTPSVIHYFDQSTGKVRREERFDLFEIGGLTVGAKEERWYRKLVRTYDPKTNRLISEEAFRFTQSPEGSKFVPINRW